MPEKVHAFHRLKENAILFAVINLKSAITAIFFIFVLGAGAAYGFFRYSENLVQVHNSSVFSISIDKPRVALQMWRLVMIASKLPKMIGTKIPTLDRVAPRKEDGAGQPHPNQRSSGPC